MVLGMEQDYVALRNEGVREGTSLEYGIETRLVHALILFEVSYQTTLRSIGHCGQLSAST
jgi:hypothetical protein